MLSKRWQPNSCIDVACWHLANDLAEVSERSCSNKAVLRRFFSSKRERLHTRDLSVALGLLAQPSEASSIRKYWIFSQGKHMSPNYDAEMVSVMRRALDAVFADQRFVTQTSKSALEIAEHILWQAANGERDLDRLKASAFAKLTSNQAVQDLKENA